MSNEQYPESCLALGCTLDMQRPSDDMLTVKHVPPLDPEVQFDATFSGFTRDQEIGALNEWSDQVHGDRVAPNAPHDHQMKPWRSLEHLHVEPKQTVIGCGWCGRLACRVCSWTDTVPDQFRQRTPRRHGAKSRGYGQGQQRPSDEP